MKEGEGQIPGDQLCQKRGEFCPPCALLDARMDMTANIRDPRNFAFLMHVALPVAKIIAAVPEDKDKVHQLFSEFLDVRERRFYDVVNLGMVQSLAEGLRNVLPKKVTAFWEAFGTLGGRIKKITKKSGEQLLFVLWKSGIENHFKNEDDHGHWGEWKKFMKLTEGNGLEMVLENAGVKKQMIKLWKIEELF
jgi:hypothetical protein